MPRTIGAALKAHLAGECAYLAFLFKITRADGVVKGFTDHDRDIVYGGVTYEADSGFTATTLEEKSDMSVDNMEVTGYFDSAQLTESDLLGGKYDLAQIEIRIVNYTDLTQGDVLIKRGWMGEVRFSEGEFEMEFRSLTQKLSQNIGSVYTPSCRAQLGDAKCGVNLAPFTFTATLTSVTSAQEFYVDSFSNTTTYPENYFLNGVVTFTSGANSGLKSEIKYFKEGYFLLALPLPNALTAGDNGTFIAGCDKTSKTCKAVFNNLLRFRGEPFIPGPSKAFQTGGTTPDTEA